MNLPESHCPILTHIVYSLLDQVDPPQVYIKLHMVLCFMTLVTATSNSSTIPQVFPES